MDLLTAQAMWTLGLLPTERLPLIAQEALERGVDDLWLAALAGLARAEEDEAEDIFRRALRALGKGDMAKGEALDVYATAVAQTIASGECPPYEGAKEIWRAVRASGIDSHELDPFIYAASEHEDRPVDRSFFDAAIVREAAEFLARGGTR